MLLVMKVVISVCVCVCVCVCDIGCDYCMDISPAKPLQFRGNASSTDCHG